MQLILQKTPVRVLHRRSPLGREKIIHWYGLSVLYMSLPVHDIALA